MVHTRDSLSANMAEAGRTWYTELDFDSYVLDLLLFGWCAICFVIILAVNAIVSAFGPLQRQPQEKFRGGTEGGSVTGAVLLVETAKWFNDAVSWFYLHYYYTPEYTDEWLKALNEQLVKLGGPVQAKFERIQSGSLPPKITHVSCEASPQDRLIIHAKLETRDLSFVVFASQQTHEGVKLTNVTASVLRLKGTLRVQSYRESGDVKVSFNFEGKPEIKVLVKPLNPYQDANELVDLGVVEANVRNSIILAKTTFTVTHLLMPGNLNSINHDFGDKGGGQDQSKDKNLPSSNFQSRDIQNQQKQSASSARSAPSQSGQQKQQESHEQRQTEQEILKAATAVASNKTLPNHSVSVQNESLKTIPVHPISNQLQQKEGLFQQDTNQNQQTVFPQSQSEGIFEPLESQQVQNSMFSAPPKPPRMVGDKRLLVKIIKANGLPVEEVGAANTVCMLSTDEPIQGYSTGVVKNTQNPFWDEHFLFDITHDTQEVRVEVYDKGKFEDEFIGESIVYVEDLRKTPSSRQILRLCPQNGNFEYNSGTVTAEKTLRQDLVLQCWKQQVITGCKSQDQQEFLFMDPSEADLLLDSMTTTTNYQLSPRRRIEIARAAISGSSHDGYSDAGLDGSPSYYEKNYSDGTPRFSYSDGSYASSGMRQQQTSTKERSSDDDLSDRYPLNQSYNQQQPIALKDSKKGGFGNAILKRFGRKKRARSADRTTTSVQEGNFLRPPEPTYGPQSKDDLELVRPHLKDAPPSPNLKKSRTLGDSLKKLFKRRSQKQSKSRENSRESSLSRSSRSKEHSRDNSLTRQSQKEYEERASSVA